MSMAYTILLKSWCQLCLFFYNLQYCHPTSAFHQPTNRTCHTINSHSTFACILFPQNPTVIDSKIPTQTARPHFKSSTIIINAITYRPTLEFNCRSRHFCVAIQSKELADGYWRPRWWESLLSGEQRLLLLITTSYTQKLSGGFSGSWRWETLVLQPWFVGLDFLFYEIE